MLEIMHGITWPPKPEEVSLSENSRKDIARDSLFYDRTCELGMRISVFLGENMGEGLATLIGLKLLDEVEPVEARKSFEVGFAGVNETFRQYRQKTGVVV